MPSQPGPTASSLQVFRGKLAPLSFLLNTAGRGFLELQCAMLVWLD